MAMEYCWTKVRSFEDDEAPGLEWQYYGAHIIGGQYDPEGRYWRVTRWAKESGETSVFLPGYDRPLPEVPWLLQGRPATVIETLDGLAENPITCRVSVKNPGQSVSLDELPRRSPLEILGAWDPKGHKGYVTPPVTLPPVTPPEKAEDDNSPSARQARALQLLKI